MVFIFYRGGWCPYCNRHLERLAYIEDSLQTAGYGIFAISPDLPDYLKESKTRHKLKSAFLSDSESKAALAFGIAYRVDSALVAKYKSMNMDLERRHVLGHLLHGRLRIVPAFQSIPFHCA